MKVVYLCVSPRVIRKSAAIYEENYCSNKTFIYILKKLKEFLE